MGFIYLIRLFGLLVLTLPYLLGDPDNFSPANSIVTPIHIQPEWYFLFAYAILRSIPRKLGGTIALIFSIAILIILPLTSYNKFQTSKYYLLNKYIFWILVISIILLTWIGIRPIEIPFIILGKILTIIYFSFYISNPIIKYNWDLKLKN